ncbi:MAG: FIST signal transduction protein [Promethearchaeota archaeon]
MVIEIGIGISIKDDSYEAGIEAATKAINDLGWEEGDFALIFSTDKYEPEEMMKGILKIIKNIDNAGCCGGGIISENKLYNQGVQVSIIKSNELYLSSAVGLEISKDGKNAGRKVARLLLDKVKYKPFQDMKKTVILLPDGISGNVKDIVEGAYSVLGASYALVGGGTGDNLKFLSTFQFHNGKVFQDAAVGIIIVSKNCGRGVAHGWMPFGDPMMTSRVDGNVIKEIDGKPAIETYSNFFKKHNMDVHKDSFSRFAMEYPFGVSGIGGTYVIRDPLSIEEAGGIVCVADIPNFSMIRIMKGNKQTMKQAAYDAAERARSEFGNKKPKLLLIFDCVSRLLLLEDEAIEEIRLIKNTVGNHVKLTGFFSFGEIGSIKGKVPSFHNKSVSLLLL